MTPPPAHHLPPLPEGPVLLYVQHVMGIGHLNRAAALARGLAGRGRDIVMVSGGRPVPHLLPPDAARPVTVEPLPSIATADLDFGRLVDEAGNPISDALWQARAARLAGVVETLRPAVLVVEMYPFGRRVFGPEIDAMIDHARALRPDLRVACSVRDILVRKTKPGWAERMVAAANARFDLILVHGDPALIPFSETFPLTRDLKPPLIHTGYIVEPVAADTGTDGRGEILVSAGGGAMAEILMDAVVAAPPLCTGAGRDHPWRVLVGRNLGAGARDRLRAAAAPGMTVEWARPDFRAMLGRAALSVSQAGYNTVTETLAAGVPAVLVPWGEGAETEQRDRAAALERLDRARVVPAAALSPEALARAVDQALAEAPSHYDSMTIALDGVAQAREALLG